MSVTKTEVLLALRRLRQAFERLEEGVRQAQDPLERDGVIQRFEFTFELLWKTLKRILEYYGVICAGPRPCIKESFRQGLLPDDEILLDMLDDRNQTSHIYDEELAETIFQRIREVYVPAIARILQHLEAKLQ